ncbi:tyrosine-type recombinase/integrase [Williamsia herbipolensis]|uniref:tyrosine-type recombinase/integrase n=1 Tax=Williamsia herbipolensis TaxID=1603258 RepID=UPI0009E32751|nr:site-specific integrase [Williamsia herbipolensis]
MSTEQTSNRPRRRPGNVRVFDAHYSDYRRRVKRASGWHVVDGHEVPKRERWQVRYVDLDGRERYETFEAKGKAQARADTLTAELTDGSHVDRRKSQTTVATVAESWSASLVSKAQSTRANYASVLANHVLPAWGSREVGSITHDDVTRWVAELTRTPRRGSTSETLSPATVHKAWIVFSGVLDYAVADGRLRANPAAKVELPKITSSADVYLSHAEVGRLAAAADYLYASRSDRRRAGRDRVGEKTVDLDPTGVPIIPDAEPSPDGLLIRFGAYSGLRVGELSGLQVRDLDLERRTIHVRRANTEVAGRLVAGLPKGGKVRSLDLVPHLVEDLRAHIAGKAPTDTVFCGATGAPLRRGNLNKRVIGPAADLAGLDGVTAHTLRHTYASICASVGVRIEIVSRWMGHASVAITQRVYVGLFDEDLSASADLVSAALAASK